MRIRMLAGMFVGAVSFLTSALAHSTLVGVFVYSNFAFDHIHVTVAPDDQPGQATELNVWNESDRGYTTLQSEVNEASKFVVFHHPKAVDKIVDEWSQLYHSIREDRSLLNKNCAYASRHLLNDILNMNLSDSYVFARIAGFMWFPIRGTSGTPFPDEVRIHLKQVLAKRGVQYYTQHDEREGLMDRVVTELAATR